ncbi:MAG TPA: hypothetical protein VF476_03180 [Chitinophagaceae bacterium]
MKALLLLPLFLLLHGRSQPDQLNLAKANPPEKNPGKELFDSEELLEIKLTGNVRDAFADRSEKPKYFPFSVYYQAEGAEQKVPVRVKTRGHFRKSKATCNYPPLLLNFTNKDQAPSSLFYNRDKVKLVMPCRSDEYVVKEYLVYKMYNLITPRSFKARLTKVSFDDSLRKKITGPFYAILLEEEESMAKRNKMTQVEPKMLRPHQAETEPFLTMAMFQYMIGNTDWSTQYRQNIKFLVSHPNDLPVTVPYDFDHAGIVNAPYARPAEELLMSSVTQRRYRGYCMTDLKPFEPIIAKFNKLKDEFYKLFTSCAYLDAKEISKAIKYLDDFYETINNPKKFERDFSYPCDKDGTGNIVIRGLREGDD